MKYTKRGEINFIKTHIFFFCCCFFNGNTPSASFSLRISFIVFVLSVQVQINIPSLPAVGPSDRLQCKIGWFQREGTMFATNQVSCDLPQPSLIPQTPADQGLGFLIELLFYSFSRQISMSITAKLCYDLKKWGYNSMSIIVSQRNDCRHKVTNEARNFWDNFVTHFVV